MYIYIYICKYICVCVCVICMYVICNWGSSHYPLVTCLRPHDHSLASPLLIAASEGPKACDGTGKITGKPHISW